MIRVLIADDEAALRELVSVMFYPERFEVRTVESGAAALAAARDDPPDVIVLDMMMPGTDGLKVCRELKADPVTGHIPIVMLTARTSIEDRAASEQAGADAHVSKPFSPFALMRTIEHLADVARRQVSEPT